MSPSNGKAQSLYTHTRYTPHFISTPCKEVATFLVGVPSFSRQTVNKQYQDKDSQKVITSIVRYKLKSVNSGAALLLICDLY